MLNQTWEPLAKTRWGKRVHIHRHELRACRFSICSQEVMEAPPLVSSRLLDSQGGEQSSGQRKTSSSLQPAASAPGRAVSPAVAQEFCHSAAGGCREQQLGCQLSATHLRQPQKFVVSISKRLKPSHLGMKPRNSTVFLVLGAFVCFFPHFTKVPVCNELEIL